MKKLYFLLFVMCIASIGYGQKKIYSESDNRYYDESVFVEAKSFEILEKSAELVSASGDTVWAGAHGTLYSSTLTRGYYFQAQSSFTISSVMCAEEGNPAALMQSVEIISFGTTVPAAWAGPGSPHTILFSALNVAKGWVACNVDILAGNYYGVVGAKHDVGGTQMYNSYGASPQDFMIDGISTTCARLLVQAPLSSGSPASGDYMSEAGGSIGRVHFAIGESIGDTIPPNVVCREHKVDLDRNGEYTLTDDEIKYLSKGTTDNETDAENLKITVSPRTITCDMAGELVITIAATDEAGNEGSCETTIIVNNTYPIQLVGGENVETVLPEGVCETKIVYPYVFAIGPCVTVTQIEGLGWDGTFPIGATTEVWVGTNTSGKTDTLSFTVTVLSEGKAPTLDVIADVVTNEDVSVSIPITGISNGGACDMSSVSLQVGFNSMYINSVQIDRVDGDSTGTLTIVPVENMSGMSEVVVLLEDGEGMQTADTFMLTISPVNDAPFVVQSIPDQELIAADVFELSLSKVLGDLFDDVDNSTLLYNVSFDGGALPVWITATDDVDMIALNIAPMASDTGCYNIVVEATDIAGAMASDTFELCVTPLLVGIDDLNKGVFELNMYPNPTKGMVTVEPSSVVTNDVEIAVMNITGSEIFRKKYRSGDLLRFDMSDHVSGMYMVIVEANNQRIVKKLILDRK